LASPQSITTVSPCAPISTFAGLMSRWTIPWRCACAAAAGHETKYGEGQNLWVRAFGPP